MVFYGELNMKTWIAQTPIDEDFNRLEQSISDIKLLSTSFTGLKTIQGIKTDAIVPISSDLTIEGCNFTDKLKGLTFKNAGYTTEYELSEVTENARRETVIDAYSTNAYVPRDDYSLYVRFVNGETYTYFNDNNNIIIQEQSSGFSLTSEGSIRITNLDTSETFDHISNTTFPSYPYYKRTYYSISAGRIKIEDISASHSKSSAAATVFVRRCKYPIVEDDPIRVLNADYSAYENRNITEADFTSFKIS